MKTKVPVIYSGQFVILSGYLKNIENKQIFILLSHLSFMLDTHWYETVLRTVVLPVANEIE